MRTFTVTRDSQTVSFKVSDQGDITQTSTFLTHGTRQPMVLRDYLMGEPGAQIMVQASNAGLARQAVRAVIEAEATPAAEVEATPLASVTERTMILRDITQTLADRARHIIVSTVLDSAEGRVSVWTTSQTETPNYVVTVRPTSRLFYFVDVEAGTARWSEPMDALTDLNAAFLEMAAHQG